jgi:pimeloyl-ACP methyl ester carboxylesterase
MQQRTGYAAVNGTHLYYELAGSGRPLVLIHGFTLDTRMWETQYAVFAQHSQALRYDLRGFGKSAVPTREPYTHPDDLRALLTFLGIEHAMIMGLSLGGGIAVDFALTYPEATDALLLVSAGLFGGYEWLQGRPSAAVRAQAQQAGLQAAKTFWLAHPLFAPAREKPLVAARLAEVVAAYSGWHLLNDDPARATEPPAIQRLDTIRAPTLIIVGERDIRDFQRVAEVLHQGIPGAKKVPMPGVGHMANMEDPERFNEIVLAFLAGI